MGQRARLPAVVRRLRDPARWRAAGWAVGALRAARAELRAYGTAYRPLAPVPIEAQGRGAVELVLSLRRATCLERSVVLQAWDAAHGTSRDVVIGVAKTGSSVNAHAWLAGEDANNAGFTEITRIPVPGVVQGQDSA
jgi:hypothetical protein